MNAEFRFHVATLCGVFMALGVGILVGTTFVGSRIVDRQSGLIARIENRVDDLARRTRENDRGMQAFAKVVPEWVSGRLLGRHIVVLDGSDYPEAAVATAELLESAGANVGRISLVDSAWGAESGRDAEDLGNAFARNVDLASRVERGMIRGPVPEAISDLIIVCGSSQSEFDWSVAKISLEKVAEAFLRTDREKRFRCVAVEPVSVGTSRLGSMRRAGLPTIDCVDQPAGAVALLSLLSRERGAPIAFGIRDDSQRRFPE